MKPVAMEPRSFTVVGLPVQQGSKTRMPTKDGSTVMVEAADKRLRPWRALVTDMATEARPAVPYDGPLEVTLVFRLPRPKVAKGAEWSDKKPDFDKLTRAVCDALTITHFIVDDARIARCVVEKRYETRDAMAGVTVTVGQLW